VYYDDEANSFIPYECPHHIVPDLHYCEFHDNKHAQNNPDKVMNSFYTLVDDAVQNRKPLFCIGFYLPGNVNLANNEFEDRVYFCWLLSPNEQTSLVLLSPRKHTSPIQISLMK
jgi:hypothetical protein